MLCNNRTGLWGIDPTTHAKTPPPTTRPAGVSPTTTGLTKTPTLRLLNVTFLNRNIVFIFFGPLTQTLLNHNRLVVQRLGLAVLVPQMGENSVNLVVGDKQVLHARDVDVLFLDQHQIVSLH